MVGYYWGYIVMKNRRVLLLSIFTLLEMVTLVGVRKTFALDSIAVKPLSKIASQSSIRDCRQGSSYTLPLITWGGDIPTIHANGNSISTKGGSLFAKAGLNFNLKREDVFADQLKSYMACKSPFLRGTAGMINMAADVTEKDSRTKMKVIYQLTWSAGGDAMVVKGGIKSPKDLKGKTIALQAYGPHVDYLSKLLSDANLSLKDVNIFWTKDLTGTESTPVEAFRKNGVDAALVIIPDALALTAGGTVGTGAEDSVKGAKILLSTKSANRIIADVYAVRSDFYEANKELVQSFVRSLLKAQEEVAGLFKNTNSKSFNEMVRASAKILLDSEQAVQDTKGMYADAEFAGWTGNQKFFVSSSYPRSFSKLNSEIQTGLLLTRLISKKSNLGNPNWDYSKLKAGLAMTSPIEKNRFDTDQVAKLVSRRQQQGTLDESGLFSFEVYFKPNQNEFKASLYEKAFKKAIDLASTYGGAILTVEGHSDPLGFLKKHKKGESKVVLQRTRQAAKNLSLSRANEVRDSLVAYAKGKGVTLDPSQFAIVGHGIENPSTGRCGNLPCAPKTKQEWLNNMRVQFRIVQVEAESSVFNPL